MSIQNYKSIFSNSFYLINSQIIARILRSLYIVVLVRYLEPELYGIFQYVQNWYVTFTPLTLLGIGAILSREIGRNKEKGQRIVGTTFVIRFSVALIVTGIVLSFGYFIEPEWKVRKLLLIFSFLIMGRALINWAKEVFTAYEKTKCYMIQVAVTNTFQFLSGLVVMYLGGDVYDLAAVYMLALLIEFLVAFFYIHKNIVRIEFKIRLKKIISVLKKGLPIGFAMVIDRWMIFGPVIICRYVLDYKFELGQIALLLLLLFFLSLVVDSFLNASLPTLSRMHYKKGKGTRRFISGTIETSIIFCTLISLAGMAFGERVIPFVFGDEFILAGEIFGATLWLLIPYTIIRSISQIYIIREHVGILSFYNLLGGIWMTGTLSLMVIKFNIIGVIYSIALGMGISVAGLIFTAIKKDYFRNENMGKTILFTAISILLYFVSLEYTNKSVAFVLASLVILPIILDRLRNIANTIKASAKIEN